MWKEHEERGQMEAAAGAHDHERGSGRRNHERGMNRGETSGRGG